MSGNHQAGFCIPYTIRETPDKGRGVFSGAAVRQGAILWRHTAGQYVVYDESSFTESLRKLSPNEAVYELTHIFCLPEFPGYMIRVLDDGVLINHSEQPNVLLNNLTREFEPLCVSSAQEVEEALLGDRFALIAAQELEVGEELTHDYNDVEDPPYYDSLCEQYGVSWEWLKS